MSYVREVELQKIRAEVYLIGEASQGDGEALQAIKDWVLRAADEGGAGVLYIDDEIAVIEVPDVITITDAGTRAMLGLPPLDGAPGAVVDRDGGEQP